MSIEWQVCGDRMERVSKPIHVAAVVLRNADGHVLTVRKRGTSRFMLPGGKPEAGEDIRDTAIRETAEELGLRLDPLHLHYLGTWSAAAANESGRTVHGTVFTHPAAVVGEARAEIEATRWMHPTEAFEDLAPLLRDHVLPALANRHRVLQRLTVFTGSAAGHEPVFADAATTFGTALAEAGVGLVYGGGQVGLMGAVADAALAAGAEVIGVMPQALADREIAHRGLTRLEVVANMHARKLRMAGLGDAFVALPGGAGTLEELFEAWTWQQLGTHTKPVALLDVDGYWQPLLSLIDSMTDRGFLSPAFRDTLITATDAADLLDQLTGWRPPASKWEPTLSTASGT